MPQVATPELVEIVVQATGVVGSGPDYNIWHIHSHTTTSAAATAAIGHLNTFYTALKPFYRTGTSLSIGFKVIDRGAVPWTLVAASPATVTGTGSTGALAAQLAMVVSWRTTTVGRSYRGRTFLGPFDSSQSAGSSWGGASATTAQTAANALVTSAAGSGTYELVVYSHKKNVMTPITSAAVGTAMRTMRSRA